MFAAALAHFVSFVIIAGAVPGGAGSGCLLAIEFFVDVAAFGVMGGAQTFESRLSFPHRQCLHGERGPTRSVQHRLNISTRDDLW